MPEMINGMMTMTGYHHDVEPERKTTTIDGLIDMGGKRPCEVHIELTAFDFEGDIAPVLTMDTAEPIVLGIMTQSAQMKLIEEQQETEGEPDKWVDEPIEVSAEDDCNA